MELAMMSINPSYIFTLDVNHTGQYEKVLEDVVSGNVQIAFPSPYLWATSPKNDTTKVTIIGTKKSGPVNTYHSWLVALKTQFTFPNWLDNLDTIVKKIKSKEIKVIINNNSYSGSTHFIPEVFLLEHEIETHVPSEIDILYLPKEDMFKMLRNVKNCIGFISSEEFTQQLLKIDNEKNNSEWKIYELPYPIPLDPVVVNKKWWLKLDVADQENVKSALNKGKIRCDTDSIEMKECESQRELFRMFVGSAVFINTAQSLIRIPEIDLLGFDSLPMKNIRNLDGVIFSSFNNKVTVDTVATAELDIVYTTKPLTKKGQNVKIKEFAFIKHQSDSSQIKKSQIHFIPIDQK
jgi:hypothetical protein